MSLGRQNNPWLKITALDYSYCGCFVLLSWSKFPPEFPLLYGWRLALITRDILYKIWEVTEASYVWLYSAVDGEHRAPWPPMYIVTGLSAHHVGTGGRPAAPLAPARCPLFPSLSLMLKGTSFSSQLLIYLTYGDFGSTWDPEATTYTDHLTSTHNCIGSNLYSKSFILCHSWQFCFSDWSLTDILVSAGFQGIVTFWRRTGRLSNTHPTPDNSSKPNQVVPPLLPGFGSEMGEWSQFKLAECKEKLAWDFWK